MPNVINATSTGNGGLITQGDDSGILNIQTNETTAITVDASQRVAFVAGTAALPSITTAGDTNTGIFFPAADTIAFSEGGAESMRIDSSGNVGIGTTSPAVRLNVTDSSDGGNSGTIRLGSDGTYYGQQQFRYNSSEYRLGVYPSGNMTFYTKGSESMRINSNGNLLVGTTTQTATPVQGVILGGADSSSGVYIGHANGTSSGNYYMAFSYNGSAIGSITQNGTTNVAYNTSSDYRLKENIQPMQNALATISQLKPVTYKWKTDGSDGQGFIAHELQAIVPDCVTGDKDAVDAEGNPVYQGIDTSFLVATLTAALQETKALLDTQAETINALTARIVALEGQ
jgi:hypothetical protein